VNALQKMQKMRMEETRKKKMARIAARMEKRRRMYKTKTSDEKKKKSVEEKSATVVDDVVCDVAGSAPALKAAGLFSSPIASGENGSCLKYGILAMP